MSNSIELIPKQDWWKEIKFFTPEEFDSPDLPGSGTRMYVEFVYFLDYLRKKMGRPLQINSGCRTLEHNASVGSKKNSAHVISEEHPYCFAADIRVTSGGMREELDRVAADYGIRRRGLARAFIHLDTDHNLPKALWLY